MTKRTLRHQTVIIITNYILIPLIAESKCSTTFFPRFRFLLPLFSEVIIDNRRWNEFFLCCDRFEQLSLPLRSSFHFVWLADAITGASVNHSHFSFADLRRRCRHGPLPLRSGWGDAFARSETRDVRRLRGILRRQHIFDASANRNGLRYGERNTRSAPSENIGHFAFHKSIFEPTALLRRRSSPLSR